MPTRPTATSAHSVHVNGVRLHYGERGKGAPTLCWKRNLNLLHFVRATTCHLAGLCASAYGLASAGEQGAAMDAYRRLTHSCGMAMVPFPWTGVRATRVSPLMPRRAISPVALEGARRGQSALRHLSARTTRGLARQGERRTFCA